MLFFTKIIQHRLSEKNIQKQRAVKKALLDDNYSKQQLEWAKKYPHQTIKHQHQTIKQSDKVVQSDKLTIKANSNAKFVQIWRHQNQCEKYLPINIVEKKHDSNLSQIIQRCFARNMLGPFVFIDENINANVYFTVLK